MASADEGSQFVVTFTATLPQLFPPHNKASAWLVRLAILRDDLAYEFQNIGLADDADEFDLWRCSYFLRRITISLCEVMAILSYEAPKYIKRARALDPALVQRFQDRLAALQQDRAPIERVRNAIGAHVRPNSTNEPPFNVSDPTRVERAVLTSLPEWTASVTLDLSRTRRTSLRDISKTAFMFAWPEATDPDSYRRHHEEYRSTLVRAFGTSAGAIDALIFLYWQGLGISGAPCELPPKRTERDSASTARKLKGRTATKAGRGQR